MTETNNNEQLMLAIQAREAEVAQYQQNITMYQAILATLPTEWPEHLLSHKGAASQHDAVAGIEDMDEVELVSKLWYADDCRRLIRTETLEMTKSKAILEALKSQI